MKKIISLLILISVIFSTLTFTACDITIGMDDTVQMIVDWIVGDQTIYTITEEEWQINMNSSNFTAKNLTDNYIIKCTGLSCYMNEYGCEKYYVLKNGVEYRLEKEEGEWNAYIENEFWYTGRTLSEMLELEIDFSDLKYNEEDKAYDYINVDDYPFVARFEFRDGVLYSATIDLMTMMFSDIGKTMIKVPEFTISE